VVSLFESGLGKALPTIRPVNVASGLESDIKVATLNSKVEPGAFVLDEMKCNLA